MTILAWIWEEMETKSKQVANEGQIFSKYIKKNMQFLISRAKNDHKCGATHTLYDTAKNHFEKIGPFLQNYIFFFKMSILEKRRDFFLTIFPSVANSESTSG